MERRDDLKKVWRKSNFLSDNLEKGRIEKNQIAIKEEVTPIALRKRGEVTRKN